MARLPRLYAPGIPQLLRVRLARPLAGTQDPTPVATLDLIRGWLASETVHRPVALHGWAILPDRIVLLATPDQAQALPAVIQGLGRRMAARLVHGRVFHERYRATLIDDDWLLPCLAWTESLPVFHNLVDTPARWPWSSAPEHIGQRLDAGLLSDHTAYWSLGNTPFARQARYQEHLHAGLTESQRQRIERALHGQWALGSEDFLARLKAHSSRRVAPAPRGRPRKSPDENSVTN